MRAYLAMAMLLCACGNGNGFHDINGGDADEDQDQEQTLIDVDVHAVQYGVWYCVPMTGRQGDYEPCYETLAECEETRAKGLERQFPEVGKCGQRPFAFCHDSLYGKISTRYCERTQKLCEESRQILDRAKNSDCERIPSKSSQLRRTRSWRTARRR